MTAKNKREINTLRLLQVQRQLKEIERELLEQEQNDNLYDAIKNKDYMANIMVKVSPNKHITVDGARESYALCARRESSAKNGMTPRWVTNIYGKIDRDVAIELFDECLTILKDARESYETMSDEEWELRRNSKVRV